MINIITGNLFDSKAQTLVNTVNCVGVMGKGIALKYKTLYPDMFSEYVKLCDKKLIQVGKLWLYKSPDKWVLNFPTKDDWRKDSKVEYLIMGLEKFVATHQQKGIKSIAFPLLGASNGGLDPKLSLDLMMRYLEKCDLEIEIYK